MTTTLERVRAHLDREDWVGAIEIATKNQREVEGNFELSWSAGWAHVRLERFAEATPYLRRALLLVAPSSIREVAVARWALGVALSHQGACEEAEKQLKASIEARDGYLPRVALVALYMRAGRDSEAEEVLREGIRLKPGDGDRVEALADFLDDVGRTEEARRLYAEAAGIPGKRKRQSVDPT
jgi:Flp pilus assembly protein TadD